MSQPQSIDPPAPNVQPAEVQATLAIVMRFAREAARRYWYGLDVDDTAQAIAIQILKQMRQGKRFGADGATRNYVKQAVRRLVNDRRKKEHRASAYAQQAAVVAEAGPAPDVALTRVSLERALESLPAEHSALVLRVAVNGEELVDIGNEVAQARATERGLEWTSLVPSEQSKAAEQGYQTVYRRYRRTCDKLQALLRAA